MWRAPSRFRVCSLLQNRPTFFHIHQDWCTPSPSLADEHRQSHMSGSLMDYFFNTSSPPKRRNQCRTYRTSKVRVGEATATSMTPRHVTYVLFSSPPSPDNASLSIPCPYPSSNQISSTRQHMSIKNCEAMKTAGQQALEETQHGKHKTHVMCPTREAVKEPEGFSTADMNALSICRPHQPDTDAQAGPSHKQQKTQKQRRGKGTKHQESTPRLAIWFTVQVRLPYQKPCAATQDRKDRAGQVKSSESREFSVSQCLGSCSKSSIEGRGRDIKKGCKWMGDSDLTDENVVAYPAQPTPHTSDRPRRDTEDDCRAVCLWCCNPQAQEYVSFLVFGIVARPNWQTACYGLFCPAASGYHKEWSGKISRKQIENF
ncbi:hypothetical protein QBC45DRAFT_483967 [Copromyces sp. CBS 386.78]|nr:hypothetical protein QBC45DRAFT_483967 [Copromyces sp. CBS 386.78]